MSMAMSVVMRMFMSMFTRIQLVIHGWVGWVGSRFSFLYHIGLMPEAGCGTGWPGVRACCVTNTLSSNSTVSSWNCALRTACGARKACRADHLHFFHAPQGVGCALSSARR